MKKGVNTKLILLTLIVIVLYVISNQIYLRLDFSEDKQYTLSKATKQIIKSVDEPVTIKAYCSEDLPPDVLKIKNDFKNMLIEYNDISNNIVYEFVNPNEDEKLEKEAMENGVFPVMINVRDKDQMKQQKAYLGAVLFYGDKKEVIPFFAQSAMEYSLSSSIKKLTIKDKSSIGLVQGHGEPARDKLKQVIQSMEIIYNVRDIDLNNPIPDDIKTIVIVSPTDTIKEKELNNLDDFLSKKNKGVLLAINKVTADPSRGSGDVLNIGLSDWLGQKGIYIQSDFVVDANCARVTVQQQQAGFSFSTQIPFPFIPLVTNFSDNPITKGLETVVMEYVSSIKWELDSSKAKSINVEPIIYSSEKSGPIKAPTYINVNKSWSEADFKEKNLPLGLVVEGKIMGDENSKMVIFADGDFAVNKNNQRQLPPDNVNLLTNAVDWLSDQTGLIDLRTKGVTSRPIDKLEESTKVFLKYLNLLFPIFVIILYGVIRKQRRLNLRLKRKSESYVK